MSARNSGWEDRAQQPKRPESPIGTALPRFGERSIGAILIDAGRLTTDEAEHILLLQREQGLRFGESAIKLGLLSPADVNFALARQVGHPYLVRGESGVSERLLVAYDSSGSQAEMIRALRSQLMLRWFDGDPSRKALAIVSAARREGRSFIAASLAIVFSQVGKRTVLIDADMRNPSQHDLFGLENHIGLSNVLSSRAGYEAIQRIAPLADLSILAAGATPPNPLELLSRPAFQHLMQDLAQRYEVVLLDSPPSLEYADAQTVARQTSGALVVGRRNVTRVVQVREIVDGMTQTGATVVGMVLNEY